MKNDLIAKICLTVCVFLSLLLLPVQFISAEESQEPEMSRAEITRLGERMYRNGILPSGEVMQAYIRGDVEIDSTSFSCSSCHLRAGLGSVEGGVVTPPTNGAKLYKPYRRPPVLADIPDRSGRNVYAKTIEERPAYTRESLARALRFGVDPAGKILNDVMPRYPLSDKNMSILVRYLEDLSTNPSPGATDRELHFATIITDDVNKEDRQALLQPILQFVEQKKQQMELYDKFLKFGYAPTEDMKYAFRLVTVDVWILNGPPSSWQAQLSEYYSKKPVFAILSGITNGEWQPIHDFCESHRLPCLFPITDYPVVSETAWYTFYYNKGFAQEGDAAARYINRFIGEKDGTDILQIVQDTPAGKALAEGFTESWRELGRNDVKTIVLSTSKVRDISLIVGYLNKLKPRNLLLWADAEMLTNLKSIVRQVSSPKKVFVSSGYLGNRTVSIPDEVRDDVYITYPYRLTPYVGPKTGGFDARVPILTSAKDFGNRRVGSRTASIIKQSVLFALSQLFDNLYRDNLLDVMSMQMDLVVKDYERLSFGPGQRYVSKGCYIIQLGKGDDPELLQRSEWVIH